MPSLALAEEVTKLHAVCVETGRAAHFASHRRRQSQVSSALRTDTFRSRDTPTSRPTQLRWKTEGGAVATWRDWSQEHASATGNVFAPGSSDGMVLHPSTDTRTLIHPSASVFAIRGPWHNGHDFQRSAREGCGVLWSEPPKPGDPWQEGRDVLVVLMSCSCNAWRVPKELRFKGRSLRSREATAKPRSKSGWLVVFNIVPSTEALSHNANWGVRAVHRSI